MKGLGIVLHCKWYRAILIGFPQQVGGYLNKKGHELNIYTVTTPQMTLIWNKDVFILFSLVALKGPRDCYPVVEFL